MRRILLITATIFLSVMSLVNPLFAAEPTADDKLIYLPIERMVTIDRSNRTPYRAIVRPRDGGLGKNIPSDVWVPLELLNDMKCGLKLSGAKDKFTARISNADLVFDMPEMKKFLRGNRELNLEFPVKSSDMRFYFNMTGMESITGITSSLTDARRTPVNHDDASLLVVGKLSLMKGIPPAAPERTSKKPDAPFNLIWDHVITENRDLASEDALPTIDVISPTWFAMYDENGNISNKGELSYTRAAHAKGYRVWALVSNGFKRDRTKKFLARDSHQNAFIAKMLAYARLYEIDGINIDFENVDNDDAARLTSFVKKFSSAARAAGLSVTMDITVPSKWSKAFERAKLGKIVDYIAVMTYDEHWGSSPKAGSVASLPWVRSGLNNTLNEIPASKLLLGIPFYTREWEESTVNGRKTVRAKTLSMTSTDQRLDETGAIMKWLPETGQNYFQYTSDDKVYRVWVEDEKSVALRLELVKKHKLAGAAFWRKGFEKPELWEQIENSMKP